MQDSIPLTPYFTMRLPMSRCMRDTRGAVAWWGVHRMLLLPRTYFSVFSGAVRPFRRAPALWDHLLHLHPAICHMGRFAQCQWTGSKPPPKKRDWEGESEYSVTGTPQDVDMENLCNLRKDRAGDLGPALKSSFSGPTCTGLVAWFTVWSVSRTHLSWYSLFSVSTSTRINQEEVITPWGKENRQYGCRSQHGVTVQHMPNITPSAQ